MYIQPYPAWGGISVIRPLTTAGDTSGTFNAIGNYGTISADFYYTVPTGYQFHMTQVGAIISTTAKLDQADYGDITGGLTNGVKLFLLLNGVEVQILAGQPLKTNNDFYVYSGEHVVKSTFSGTPQTLSATFDLIGDYGNPIVLKQGERIIVRLNDNFSTLLAHKFIARGVLVPWNG